MKIKTCVHINTYSYLQSTKLKGKKAREENTCNYDKGLLTLQTSSKSTRKILTSYRITAMNKGHEKTNKFKKWLINTGKVFNLTNNQI